MASATPLRGRKLLKTKAFVAALATAAFSGTGPLLAQDAGSYLGLTGPTAHSLGTWSLDHPIVAPADFFVLPDVETAGLSVPHQTPFVATRRSPQTGATDVLALIFSDAPVTCAEEVGTFLLDTSFAAFLTTSDALALATYGAHLAETGEDPANITGDPVGPAAATLFELSDEVRFPIAWVGFEGDFPLYAFYDAAGEITALAGLFGLDIRNGPDLPPCTAPIS